MSIRVIANDTTYFLRLDMLGQGELARVFPAYQEGQEPTEAHWAVKLAKDQQHNVYIEQEYHTLVKLHQAIALLPKEVRAFPEVTPLPGVQLGAASDGRQALIMQPLLNQSLLAAYESLSTPLTRERLALTAARQYTDLLQALARANLSCQDRKLGDLWWVGPPETGHLVVTDWNVVSETANPTADLRRFGLLWFELIIGPQMPPNFQPKRQDFERVQDRVSYGLWYALGRALGSTMGPPWHHCQELADLLADLSGFYRQPPLVLTQQARASLSRAQSNLDRSQADLAWIQFDIAQRLNNGKPVTGLDQARQWAYNPVAQASPGLVRRLASPHFSEIGEQLQELAQRAQRPQELGDINRLQFGFNLLNTIKDILIKGNTTTDLAYVGQQFAQAQELLVEGVLRPLMNKDGAAAAPTLSKLRALLPVKLAAPVLDPLESLEQETAFWLDYDAAQRNLHTQPALATASLENCQAARPFIRHWPEAYEPTLDDLRRLAALAETNARAAILAGESGAPPIVESKQPHGRPEQPEMFQPPGPPPQRPLPGGGDTFNPDITRLQEQAGQFLSLTRLLSERAQDLEQALVVYTPFAAAPSPAQTAAFLTNTLRLYLGTAQAEIQASRSAARSLARAESLLAQAGTFLSPEELTVYQDLHAHLVDLDKNRLSLPLVVASVTEAQLENWFKTYRFEECYENLAGLKNEDQRQKWLTRLNDATKLREVMQHGQPKSTANYFRKRQMSQLFIDTLDTLRHYAQTADPMAYALYAEEIRELYEQIWQALGRLDKKAAEQVEPKLPQ